MLKTKMLAMFGGVAVLASALVPGLASAHDRDDWRDGRTYSQPGVQVQPRMDAASWTYAEHERMHAENPYMTPWQHERMHRWLRAQGRRMEREEWQRREWRAERERRWDRDRDDDHDRFDRERQWDHDRDGWRDHDRR